jgi:hypothetical protein
MEMMDVIAAQLFQTECECTFNFLVRDYGFSPASLDVNQNISFATVTFMAKNIALECVYDEREMFVEMYVARVSNGVKASEYAIDAQGQKVRERLLTLLIRRGARGVDLKDKKLAAHPINEMFQIKLNAYAELLKAHGRDILSDSSSVLAD